MIEGREILDPNEGRQGEEKFSITKSWQEVADLPPMPPAGDIAERLVLLAHFGADFTVWGSRRNRYWDAITERVKASTYAGPGLADWWQGMSKSLPCSPRNIQEREDLVFLLSYSPARDVLDFLRNQPEVIVLRVRVIAEMRREMRVQDRADEEARNNE